MERALGYARSDVDALRASSETLLEETARLETKEAALNKEIRRDRRDGGKLTRAERRKINRQQNALSRQIARQKHDAQKQ